MWGFVEQLSDCRFIKKLAVFSYTHVVTGLVNSECSRNRRNFRPHSGNGWSVTLDTGNCLLIVALVKQHINSWDRVDPVIDGCMRTEHWWKDPGRQYRNSGTETSISATWSTTNLTCTGAGSNRSLRGDRQWPVTSDQWPVFLCQSHDTYAQISKHVDQ